MAAEGTAAPPREADTGFHGEQVTLRGLTKHFGSTVAVDELDLDIGEGEFFALLGPSGCGKTTTMRMIAGFEKPTGGEVWIGSTDASTLVPADRGTGMVFQSYALFPHYDVFMNVAYGLVMDDLYGSGPGQKARAFGALMSKRLAKRRSDFQTKVHTALEQVALLGYEDRKISELSGGQQQRVALARALVKQPSVLLMDEPLSNLDKKLRIQMRTTIREIQQRLGITAMFVTHDQEEAMGMADRVGVMRDGQVVQVGTPTEVYSRPADPWTADFVGNSNLLEGTVARTSDGTADVDVRGNQVTVLTTVGPSAGEACWLLMRPENVELVRTAPDAPPAATENRFNCTIRTRAFLGATVQYTLGTNLGELLVEEPFRGESLLLREGEEGELAVPSSGIQLLLGRAGEPA